jgi:hypothetical protein
MGVDFRKKTNKSFVKAWDQNATELKTSDLYRQNPALVHKSYLLTTSAPVAAGDCLVGRLEDGRVRAYKGLACLGDVAGIGVKVLAEIEQLSGIVKLVVEQVHPQSGAADVIID